jgi:hypothetical protein
LTYRLVKLARPPQSALEWPVSERLAGRGSVESRDVSVRRDPCPVEEHAEALAVVHTFDPAGETEELVIYLTNDCAPRSGRDTANCFAR